MGAITSEAINYKPKRRWTFNSAILLGVPYIAFMLMWGIVPMLLALVFSLAKFGGYQPVYWAAMDFSNYKAIFMDPQFVKSFGNILKFAAVSLPVSFIGALAIALILDLVYDRLGGFMRTIYFLPGAITLSAVALIAIFMFDPGVSPFAPLLHLILPKAKIAGDIINNNSLVPFLVIVRFFSIAGGWIAIFYGALSGINKEITEAAIIDGCGPWALEFYIKRPMIMGFVWYMLITLTIASLQLFTEPFIISTSLTISSPLDPYWSPNMWAQFITVRTGDFGKSAVISLVMLGISLVAAYFIITRTGFFKTDVTK